ncbi:MAG TPA: tRNA pseudouridine(38-40) synthase TruA, partial [Candidatus Cloacimonadota bacterium]|nr:tRNA pseudouridine(38-40) synthase TruA [Candidatus Cloacimonadota bacterium]
MSRRILLKICYDGSGFSGWQSQKHARSVQAELEKALRLMAGQDLKLVCSGRTDAGVHAESQYAHFDFTGRMASERMPKALNRLLSSEIRILDAQEVPAEFSARYAAWQRSYKYLLAKKLVPFRRLYTGFMINQNLELGKLRELALPLSGKHDWSSFAQPNPEIPNRVCELEPIRVRETEEQFEFLIVADRFLHNMVRRIVGTLANACTKDLAPETLASILSEADPKQTLVVPAPAAGLYLLGV